MRRLPVIAAAAVLFASTIASQAATIWTAGTTIFVDGQIVQGDFLNFAGQFYDALNVGQPIEAVSLNSPGGVINEGIAMANVIHGGGLITVVNPKKVCASACFIMFAAGSQRVAGDGAKIGVHSATTNLATCNDNAPPPC